MKNSAVFVSILASVVISSVVTLAIVKNTPPTPEGIQHAIAQYQEQLKDAMNQTAINVIKQNAALLNDAPMIGNAAAPKTIIEVLDYQCSGCRASEADLSAFQKTHLNGYRFVFLPLTFIGDGYKLPTSRDAAVTALYVYKNDPQNFAAINKALFEGVNDKSPAEGDQLTKEVLLGIVKQNAPNAYAGVDAMLSDRNSKDYVTYETTLDQYRKVIDTMAAQGVSIYTPMLISGPNPFTAETPTKDFKIAFGFSPKTIATLTS